MLFVLAGVLILVVLIVVAVQLNPVQNFVKDKAVTYLQHKLKTRVAIGHISIIYPKDITIDDVYVADQQNDTLISSHRLAVNINLPALLHSTVEIRSLHLEGFNGHINRSLPSGEFNFAFITKAFASSAPAKPQPADTSSLKITLGDIDLDKIRFSYQDTITGYHALVALNQLHTRIEQFDLKHMQFGISALTLTGLNTRIIQQEPDTSGLLPKPAESASPSPGIVLKLGNIQLANDKINFSSQVLKLATRIDLHKLDLNSGMLDLGGSVLKVNKLDLNGTKAVFRFLKKVSKEDTARLAATRLVSTGKKIVGAIRKNLDQTGKRSTEQRDTEVRKTDTTGWKVDISAIKVADNSFTLDDENSKPVTAGIDYSHLALSGLTLDARNLHYEPAYIQIKLNELQGKDKSGIDLRHAAGAIFFSDQKTQATNLHLETANTRLDATLNLRYRSVSSLSKNIGALGIEAVIRPSVLGLKDILYFQPALGTTEPFKKGGLNRIKFEGTARGRVDDLEITRFEASALSHTHLLVRGHINGLPDPKKLLFNIRLDDFSTGKNDIRTALSNGMVPPTIQLPDHLKVQASLNGTLQDLHFNSALASSLGNLNAGGQLKINPAARDTAYLINLQATNVQAGRLSGSSQLGQVSLQATVNGSGLSLARASAAVQGRVLLAQYHGYSYRNLTLKGHISGRQIQLQAAMPDPNLNFRLKATADLRRKAPAITLQLRLDSADFKALRFSKTTARLRGNVNADIPNLDLKSPEAEIRLNKLLLVTDSASIPLDSLNLSAHTRGGIKDIEVQSEFLKASLTGQISLTEIAGQLSAQLNSYYTFTEKAKKRSYPAENFQFSATLFGPPALHKLVPKLASFSPVLINGAYNSVNQRLLLHVSAPHTQYADISMDSLRLNIVGDASKLNYSLQVDSVSSSSLDLQTTTIGGYAQNSILHLNIDVKDGSKKEKYQLAATIAEHLGNYQFKFIPGDLLINYQPWTVAGDNLLQYGKGGILAHNLNLSNGNSSLSVNSVRQIPNAPLNINLRRFDLATISRFLEKDSVLVRGQLDGGVIADNLTTSPVFTSDLTLSDFSFKRDTLGTVHLKVDNKIKNTFTAAVTVSGHGNQLSLNGDYDTGNSTFNAVLDVIKLNLSSVQIYTMNQITHSKGFINGQLNMSGTAARPQVTGALGFNHVGFNLTYLNSDFTLPVQQIIFDGKGLHFNDFLLLDSAKNKLDLDGDILTSDYHSFRFDLNLSSTDFRVLNSKPAENSLFYGTVYLNSDIDITGDLNKPKIDADITLNNKTRFTYVIPADDPAMKENNGIVKFVDYRDSVLKAPVKKAKSAFKGFDFSANLNIEKDAQFTVIIDPQTGDALKVKGEATLNTTIDASGKVSLTGRYEISEGSYQLSLNSFVKKSFSIQKGSTIVWTGEPTSATVDITAVYQANAASIDLMAQQTDAADANKYKQLLPFQLNLMMAGELLKPVITFSITLPERERNLNPDVQAQLDVLRQDPSELNKQVFALLVLGRFVGQNPFQSASGGGLDAGLVARQSAGKIMSQQLNKIAGNLIKGVDLNFDLNSHNNYSSGDRTTQTDLKIGATKSFNDRLSVSVGSDIALEGSQSQASTSTLIGDVSVEYKLSKDGRYRLRAFRRNATEEYVEGQFIETGLSFTLVIDYDKFREIFKATKKQPAIKPTKP